MSKRVGLSGATLKALACVFMCLDHAGMLLFPRVYWLRCVGRLAFPIFAFFIAEGCRYTKNRARYLARIALLGVGCEAVYMMSGSAYYGNILITFSLSIALIYLWQECQARWDKNKRIALLWGAAFAAATAAVGVFVHTCGVDYGFAGVMTAVLVSIAQTRHTNGATAVKRWDRLEVRLVLLAVALIWVVAVNIAPMRQLWSLLALPLLLLYNGTAGKRRFQYGFYVFYPLHLALLQMIAWGMGR